MYCPNCSQQQVSGDLSFCSGCGLPMGLVGELLKNGGSLPQLEELLGSKKGFFRKIFTRKNGIFFSIIWFIFFTPFMAAIWGGAFGEEEIAAFFAIFGVFSSLLIFLFSLFFLGTGVARADPQTYAQKQKVAPQNLSGAQPQPQQKALPTQQSQNAEQYVSPEAGMWKAPDTGDLVTPGSVTEGTTRLLQKDDEN